MKYNIRMDYKVNWYTVKGYDLELYCKVTEYGNLSNNNYKSTMSFGTGAKKWCVIASYTQHKTDEIYIDRIERQEVCTLRKPLSSFKKGTIKFIKIALWTMKHLYPYVNKFTFKDDSQIFCDSNNTNKIKDTLYLSYDYILKYNETWYQNKFNAELPGFISKTLDKTSKLTNIISEKGSYMDSVYNSFKILDNEITPLPLIIDLLPFIIPYSEQYESSKTPRIFINKLRTKLGNKYCNIVGKWLNKYMSYLKVKIEMDKWYILEKYITKPDNYSFILFSDKNIYIGGSTNNMKRYTRSKKHYNKSYYIISNNILTNSFIGGNYNDY